MSEEWISASQAREIVSRGWRDEGKPTDAICGRAKQGAVRAKAWQWVTIENGQRYEKRDHSIPPSFWDDVSMTQNWSHGDFASAIYPDDTKFEIEAIGVTFERTGIEAMAPPIVCTLVSTQPVATAASSRPGRLPYDDWEAVMIEMARQLFVGDLQPKKLADIERAIADYLLANGVTRSESTVREHARPFWNMYEREAGK